MNLTVFGANGPTGRQVVRQALAAGHHVAAVTRKPDAYPMRADHLDVITADVTDLGGVERAVSGCQAVISTFGVPYSRKPITVYSEGIANVLQAMTAQGIGRLVCVSSTTLATEEVPGETLFWRKGVVPLLRNVLGRTLYEDMQRMEERVVASSLNWTIVRPGGLFDTAEPTSSRVVSPQRLLGRYTSRADLANVLIEEATQPRHPKAVVEVITKSARPPSGWTFLKEAMGGRD